MARKESYLYVKVGKMIDIHDLECSIENIIDQVEPRSGWLSTTNMQVLCFTIEGERVEEVERAVKDFLTDQSIEYTTEVSPQ